MSKLIDYKDTSKKVYLNFGDQKIKVSPDTFEHFNFKIGEEYDLNEIEMQEKINDLYEDSVKKLSKKIISVEEYRKRLEAHRILDSDGIEAVIKKLQENNYLNDEVFAELFTDALNKEYYGKYHILNELRKKGIRNNIVEEIDFDYEAEEEKARTYFKLISNKYASNNYAKQKRKIYNELLKRGFDIDIINKICNEIQLVESREIDKLRKDYNKIKSKLGIYEAFSEINEGKIISALIKLGYSYRDIIEIITEDREND